MNIKQEPCDLAQTCLVCNDVATGKHYGVISCEGCKGFFKRSIRKEMRYTCREEGKCSVDRLHRNRCRLCRLNKCLRMGMKRSAVQMERSASGSLQNCTLPSVSGSFKSKLTDKCEFAFEMEFPKDSKLTMEYVYEIVTRLLFFSIDWVNVTHSFKSLDKNDQVLLLQSSWTDIFLLSFVQCGKVCRVEATLNVMKENMKNYDIDSCEANKSQLPVKDIDKVKDLLLILDRLELTPTEYALLKLICLFNPDVTGLKCVQDIEKMQEMAQSELQDYVRESSSTNQCRFARILLRLPAIKTISSIRVEEIFFSPLIGDVKIDHILPSILSNNSGSLV